MKIGDNLVLDFDRQSYDQIKAKQGDVKSRYLDITVTQNGTPLDLTGNTARIYVKKPDNTIVFNEATILDGKTGKIRADITSQMLALEGTTSCELVIFGTDSSVLGTQTFNLSVEKCIRDDSAIISSNEFSALTIALNKVDKWDAQFKLKYEGLEAQYAKDIANVKSQLTENATKSLATSMPINSLTDSTDGIIAIDSIKGRTLKNEVINGNFSNGTTGWSIQNAVSTVVDTTLRITGTGTGYYIMARTDTNAPAIIGHKIYVRYIGKLTADGSNELNIQIGGTNGGSNVGIASIPSPITGKTYIVSGIGEVTNQIGNISVKPYAGYVDSTIAKDKTLEIKEVLCIDLTATFGVGKEPTKEWCDQNVQWLDGIKSVGETDGNKLEVLSKESIDYEKGTIDSDNGFEYNSTIRVRTKDYFPYESITDVVNLDFNKYEISFCLYDNNKIYLKSTSWLISNHTFTESNGKYFRFIVRRKDNLNITDSDLVLIKKVYILSQNIDKISIQLKEPLYEYSYIDFLKNKVVYGTSKSILDDNRAWYSYNAINTNNTLVFSTNLDAIHNASEAEISNLICDKFPPTSVARIYESDVEGITFNSVDPTNIRIRILKSKLTSYGFIDGNTSTYVTAFRAYVKVNPITVYYKSTKPVEEDLNMSSLKCFKGGTLQLNNAIAPIINIKYPSNVASRLSNIEDTLDNNVDRVVKLESGLLATILKTLDLEKSTTDIKNNATSLLDKINILNLFNGKFTFIKDTNYDRWVLRIPLTDGKTFKIQGFTAQAGKSSYSETGTAGNVFWKRYNISWKEPFESAPYCPAPTVTNAGIFGAVSSTKDTASVVLSSTVSADAIDTWFTALAFGI